MVDAQQGLDSPTGREAAPDEGWTTRSLGRRREDRFVGASRDTQRLIDQASAAARTELPVLIVGPPGAGKEFVARAIHAWSARASGPFLRLPIFALPAALQGRELFGSVEAHEATGHAEHEGALAQAAGGTLFLESIERLRTEVRADLVGALAERRYRRLGDSGEALPLRSRLIASAEHPPAEPCFGDLEHHAIVVPALAERREDVLPLATHFLAAAAEEAGVKPIGFTPDARSFLLAEPWAGNVRELRDRVRQATRLAKDGAISAEALRLAGEGEEIPSFKDAKRAFETHYVVTLLRRCGGNISRAARLAKKDRKDFYDVIRRTGVDPSQFRS